MMVLFLCWTAGSWIYGFDTHVNIMTEYSTVLVLYSTSNNQVHLQVRETLLLLLMS
jgi:hypothetical protein